MLSKDLEVQAGGPNYSYAKAIISLGYSFSHQRVQFWKGHQWRNKGVKERPASQGPSQLWQAGEVRCAHQIEHLSKQSRDA